jgi:hypothetical protein
VSRSRPEPCKDSRKLTDGASLWRHLTTSNAQLPTPKASGVKVAATSTPRLRAARLGELGVGFFGS